MARKPRRNPPDAGPARIALEHAVRRWEAEVENDRKLSQRENGLMTFVAAVLGLGLFKLELLAAPDPSGWIWIVRALVTVSFVLLFGALAKLLLTAEDRSGFEPRPRGLGTQPKMLSSTFLRWPEQPGRPLSSIPETRDASLVACELTTSAATSLHLRNLDRLKAIDQAEKYLPGSAIVAGLAFACYLWSHTQ